MRKGGDSDERLQLRAEQLFQTYFELLHPHLPFLDREHSTPAALAQRNNFLFNASMCY
jgi:hypothetical protein